MQTRSDCVCVKLDAGSDQKHKNLLEWPNMMVIEELKFLTYHFDLETCLKGMTVLQVCVVKS